MFLILLALFFPLVVHAQADISQEQVPRDSTNTLWNNDAVKLDVSDLQTQLQQTQITQEEAQKIGSCIEKLSPRIQAAAGAAPDAQLQRDIAECYRGTQLEQLLTPVYQKIATIVDCSRDKLGVQRVADMTRLASEPTTKELSIIKKCYIERTAPIVTVAAIVNTVATGGLRNILLLLYVGATNVWNFLRQRKSNKFGTVINSLSKLPVDLAIVRLSTPEGRAVRSTVSDQHGRFYVFGQPGNYSLSVTKPGFTFPSQFAPTLSDATNALIHNETSIQLTHQSPVLQYTLPADPEVQEETVPHARRTRYKQAAGSFIAVLSPALGIGAAAASPEWWVIGFAVLNILTYVVFRYFAARMKPRAFGTVQDKSGAPVADTIVRVFDTHYNKLVASLATNSRGQYGAMASKGQYAVKYEKPGVGVAERTVLIIQEEGVIAETVTIL